MIPLSRRRLMQALGVGGAASVAGCTTGIEAEEVGQVPTSTLQQAQKKAADRVAADPTNIPPPINRDESKHHDITLQCKEVTAEIEPGVTFNYMTFGGTVPGPMVRVRQGDTVSFELTNPPESNMPHNVDFHAIYGTGGGSIATDIAPGEANAMEFKAMYPGAYIYHCAVPDMDYHISSGMFGMIVVEPKGGLPDADREFYFGQHEVYTDKLTGEDGHHSFDMDAMAAEQPTYVLLNGEKYAYAADNYGPLQAKLGETIRVFMVTGGPNLSSSFHPIGNVWSRAYRDGGLPEEGDLAAYAEKNIQTMTVPPGSCMIGEMETPVPTRIKLVDHSLSRVVRKGLLAEIDVTGPKKPEIFDPEPNGPDEGPIYGDDPDSGGYDGDADG